MTDRMGSRPKVLFLITARAGSKGVPRKNLREIDGMSLLGYKAVAAQRSRYCDRLVVSTESAEIQAEAARHGAEVLFTRPAELASDTASSLDVVLHAIEWFDQHTTDRFDALMLLEPSAPFARPQDFDAAVELFHLRNANLVVGMRATEVNSIFVGPLTDDGRITTIIDQMATIAAMRRQDVAQEYTMNGALYLIGWEFLKRERRIYADRDRSFGYVMPGEHSIEIDSPRDLTWAEFLVERGDIDLTPWRSQ